MQSTTLHEYQAETIEGDLINLTVYKGRKLMIVNTASKCGYTPQYEELQELHEKYGNKLIILGFPSGDFGGQELSSNDKIVEFCQVNYGVTFQLFSKTSVKGKNQHPVYSFLSDKTINGKIDQSPTWNFCKYLVNEEGKVEKFLPSNVSPLDDEIIAFATGS